MTIDYNEMSTFYRREERNKDGKRYFTSMLSSEKVDQPADHDPALEWPQYLSTGKSPTALTHDDQEMGIDAACLFLSKHFLLYTLLR